MTHTQFQRDQFNEENKQDTGERERQREREKQATGEEENALDQPVLGDGI